MNILGKQGKQSRDKLKTLSIWHLKNLKKGLHDDENSTDLDQRSLESNLLTLLDHLLKLRVEVSMTS